jgi:hypothetical protein
MIADYVCYVELGILSDPVGGRYEYEVGSLSQAVHDDPYRVVPTRGVRQTHNEVHTDVFPFPLKNSQMIGLDSSTGVTFRHILRYLSFHSHPLEILL